MIILNIIQETKYLDDYHSTSDSFQIRHGLTSGIKTEHHISFPQALYSKKILEVNSEKVIMVILMVMPNLFTLPLNGNKCDIFN